MSTEKKYNGPWWMMRNSAGKRDAALTLMVLAFLFSLGMAAVGVIEELAYDGSSITFRQFDMGFATTVLVPLIALYFGRRYTSGSASVIETQKVFAHRGGKKVTSDEDQKEQD